MEKRDRNIQAMLKIFHAIERRDPATPDLAPLLDLFQPDVKILWPPSLPYGGASDGIEEDGRAWINAWDPVQPTAVERSMSPRALGADENEVVMLYRQQGVWGAQSFETEVVGIYGLVDGKLARAQMFYFDEAGVNRFLRHAARTDR